MLMNMEETEALLDVDLSELMAMASEIRNQAFGNIVTYSPKVFIPLTNLCNDKCGYCTFAQPPARIESPFLDVDQVIEIASKGREAGCHEALFTLGERPELRYPIAAKWLEDRGYNSTIEYLIHVGQRVLEETELLPHGNCGALYREELLALRQVCASQGMMLESTNPDLACHRGSPDKNPTRRIATLEYAGQESVPFTTGLLVGIGESRKDRLDALLTIADIHQRHCNIQEVIIQNFLPKPGTSMSRQAPCPIEEHFWTIALARVVLPDDIHIQAPPNLTDNFAQLLDCGIDDWGGISPVTIDHVNPERSWPQLDILSKATSKSGYELVPRLTIYPEFASHPDKWLAPPLRFPVLRASDSLYYARDHKWTSGGEIEPPLLKDTTHLSKQTIEPPLLRDATYCSKAISAKTQIDEILDVASQGKVLDETQIAQLFAARGSQVLQICEYADELRSRNVGDLVTWVANRNINYTNVCTFKCKFCAFSKGPLSLNLRGSPYLLSLDEITERVVQAVQLGATEVCLQGGIHPSFDGDYYIDVIKAVRQGSPDIHIHGFTALEVTEGAHRLDESLESYLIRLREAGLKTLPGTAAEILDDEVRKVLCPDKISTEQWLEVHRTAHSIGLRSNVTIMFGSIEQPIHWARHIVRTRDLQQETGGFTEFVPLPFVHMASPIYLQGKSRKGPTFREALLMHAIGRIAYDGFIDNVQVSWVKMGISGAQQILCAGANDLGGTLINENISRAAGASHGQQMSRSGFEQIVGPLGRPLAQRTTLYGLIDPPDNPKVHYATA